MAKQYQMADLGYPRTPTSAMFRVEMPDGTWQFPVQIIADSRDAYYACDGEDTIAAVRAGKIGTADLTDWAAKSLAWSDVAQYTSRIPTACVDREQFWGSGRKSFSGTI